MGGAGGGAPWASMVQLRQAYAVKTVPLDAQVIDPDVQVLLLAHAQNLSDATLYAIDQFVMRGGRLMAMVDPNSDAEANLPGPNGQPPTDTASNLKKLFDAWGIVTDPTQVVGDLTGAWRVRSSASDRVQAVDYVAWFNIRDGISHDDPATADLTQVTVATAGAIAKKDGADLEFTPLLSTDDKSALIPVDQVRTDPDPAKILGAFHPDGKIRVIAARVRGVLKSAFAGPPDSAARPNASGELPRVYRPDRPAGEHGRRRRQRHPGGPLLGARRGFLRPEPGDAVQRQRPIRRQSRRHARGRATR